MGWKPWTLGAGVSKAVTVMLLSSSEAGGRPSDPATGPGACAGGCTCGLDAVRLAFRSVIGLLIGILLAGIVIARYSVPGPRLSLPQSTLTSRTGVHHERLDPPCWPERTGSNPKTSG